MTVDKRLLDILVCPACAAAVAMEAAGSGLECQGCRRVYPVRDGIPVMLIDEAVAVDEAEHEALMTRAASEGISPTFEA